MIHVWTCDKTVRGAGRLGLAEADVCGYLYVPRRVYGDWCGM